MIDAAHMRWAAVRLAFFAAVIAGCGGYIAGRRTTEAPRAEAQRAEAPVACTPVEVHFAPSTPPDPGPEAAIDTLIDGAHSKIQIQAYGFSSEPTLEALEAALGRGVEVDVILDKSDEHTKAGPRGAPIERMVAAGAHVWVDHAHPGIAHSKVLIVDGSIVETGSHNYTANAAHRDAENIVVIRDARTAGLYSTEWERHRFHADMVQR